MEIFQYDPQHRRDVEGWNIICFDGEDKIGLEAHEWEGIGCDFLYNEMYVEAEKSFKRGIALGSYRCVAYLGEVYQKQHRLEEAYRCYLEAAMANDKYGVELLSEMYRKGIYVRKDKIRAEELIRNSGHESLIHNWECMETRKEDADDE